MKRASNILLGGLLTVALATPTMAGDLIGYYDFEGNFNDTSVSINSIGAAAAGLNPGEVSFSGGGFRGQAVDINDPSANGGGNNGGSVNVPINVSPPAAFSFGGWVNLQSNAGFPGFAANDNGGWDRGIHLNGNNWGIASGGALSGVAPAPTGAWTYVVGTFDKAANQATLYVGDDTAATQTTTTGSRVDGAANGGGLPVLEIGRYDNQDFDGLVDDFTVWDGALTPHEANAVRNLRLSSLDISPVGAETLFDLFNLGSGPSSVGGLEWEATSGLNPTNPGEVFDLGGGQFAVVLNTSGDGLVGSAAVVPEPASIAIWSLLGLCLAGYGYRRQRRQK